jgi:hypothetical protein
VDYDNTTNIQRLAVEAIGPEEVLIIDAREEVRTASFGHIIATRIMKRGAAGLVTDGALRDTPRFRSLNLPVYARAAHHRGSVQRAGRLYPTSMVGSRRVGILSSMYILPSVYQYIIILWGLIESITIRYG